MGNRRILIAIAIIIVLGVLIVISLPLIGMHLAVRRIEQRAENLLKHTNHVELLHACRKVITEFQDVPRPPNGNMIILAGRDSRLPSSLRRIKASYIMVASDDIHVELGGGFHHFGVKALAKRAPQRLAQHLDSLPDHRRLLDRLWYYED